MPTISVAETIRSAIVCAAGIHTRHHRTGLEVRTVRKESLMTGTDPRRLSPAEVSAALAAQWPPPTPEQAEAAVRELAAVVAERMRARKANQLGPHHDDASD
jgi:hypothetical protein